MPIPAQRIIKPEQIRNFGRIGETIDVPPLTDVQLRSYDRFLVILARSDVASGNPAGRAAALDRLADRQCLFAVDTCVADEHRARDPVVLLADWFGFGDGLPPAGERKTYGSFSSMRSSIEFRPSGFSVSTTSLAQKPA